MEECTFSPRVQVTNQAKKYEQMLGNRTGKAFNLAQD